jgi:tetratricopeptide (TPR) repeat protein
VAEAEAEEPVVAEAEEAREEAVEEAAFEEAAEEVVAVAEEEAEEPEDFVAVSEEEPAEAVGHEAAAEGGDFGRAVELIGEEVAGDPDNVELRQRLVEYAFRLNDDEVLTGAYLNLADCLRRTGSPAKAQAVYQQVLSTHPGNEAAEAALAELEGTPTGPARAQVTTSEEYVDLGSMILDDEPEDTTRWVVAAEAPSGDDETDFANMLSQFKQKVSEHVAADDVTAHHDLGTAYMEMGLLDEAVAEFQQALRAASDHLPTFEMLGRCFMEKGDYEIAVKSLTRALEAPFEVEDELIGIYYQLGKANEELGNKDQAVEFYEKVFSLDINFEDVTERLRALR